MGAGHQHNDLDYSGINALTAGAGITDSNGGNANLKLPAPNTVNSLSFTKGIAVDGVIPTVISIGSPNADGAYTTSATLHINLLFSESVIFSDSAQLHLDTRPSTTILTSTTLNQGNILVFEYRVGSTDNSNKLEVTNANALSLVTGTLRDTAGNNASLIVPTLTGMTGALTTLHNIVIDTISPQLVGVSVAGNNNFLELFFSEGIFSNKMGQLPMTVGTISIELSTDSQSTIGATSLTNFHGMPLSGGEANVRVLLNTGDIPDISGIFTVNVSPCEALDQAGLQITAASATANVVFNKDTNWSITLQSDTVTPAVTHTFGRNANASPDIDSGIDTIAPGNSPLYFRTITGTNTVTLLSSAFDGFSEISRWLLVNVVKLSHCGKVKLKTQCFQ